MACEVFKITCINKMSPEYINDLVEIKTSTYNFRVEKQAEGPRVNTARYGLRSFRSEAAWVWNRLLNEVRVAESYPQFRSFSLSAVLMLFLTVCIFLIFRLGKPVVLPFRFSF